MSVQTNTEDKILLAARKVFVRKGYSGARMQEIADEAGINKALLHYYFRSKEKLFQTIFSGIFNSFMPKVGEKLLTDSSIQEKIRFFIDNYIDTLEKNPDFPIFILHELSTNPENVAMALEKGSGIIDGKYIPSMIMQLQAEEEKGNIRQINPRHFIINLLGMCLFPFIGRPVIQKMLFQGNNEDYDLFMCERKEEIFDFVNHSLRK